MNIYFVFCLALLVVCSNATTRALRSRDQILEASRGEQRSSSSHTSSSGGYAGYSGSASSSSSSSSSPFSSSSSPSSSPFSSFSSFSSSSSSTPPPAPLPLKTVAGQRAQFTAENYTFDLLGSTPTAGGSAGEIRPLTVVQLPALAGEGLSYFLFNIEPCGINLPHSHPRATELLYVIDSDSLLTGLVEENARPHVYIRNVLKTGHATFFPVGLIHFQQNLSCRNATFISALNSEDPGVITTTLRLFDITDDELLAASLNVTVIQVQTIRNALPESIAPGLQQCRSTCGLL